MEKLERFYKFVDSVLIIIIVYLEGRVAEGLEAGGVKNFWTLLVVSAVILILVFEFLGWLIQKAVENISWIKMMILGSDYIEGTWFDVVETNGTRFYGLYTISYMEGRILQEGDQVSSEGKVVNSWKTVASNYQDHTLSILYKVQYFDEQRIDHPYGISFTSFSSPSSRKVPLVLNGIFYDISTKLINEAYRGFKVVDKNLLKELNNPEENGRALKTLMSHSYLG